MSLFINSIGHVLQLIIVTWQIHTLKALELFFSFNVSVWMRFIAYTLGSRLMMASVFLSTPNLNRTANPAGIAATFSRHLTGFHASIYTLRSNKAEGKYPKRGWFAPSSLQMGAGARKRGECAPVAKRLLTWILIVIIIHFADCLCCLSTAWGTSARCMFRNTTFHVLFRRAAQKTTRRLYRPTVGRLFSFRGQQRAKPFCPRLAWGSPSVCLG